MINYSGNENAMWTLNKSPIKVRSVWIADVQLDSLDCLAEFLANFRHILHCNYLHSVGDIIDVWEMEKRLYWLQSDNNVIRILLGKAKNNSKVISAPLESR